MDYDYGYSAATGSAAMAAFFAIYFGFIFLIIVGSYLLTALSLSSFFKKVGVESWIAWVPIYQYWKWLEVGGQKGWLSLLMLVPYANYVAAVFLYIGMYRTGRAFGKDGGFLVLGIFLPFVWAFILGGRNSGEYHPEWFAAYGWPPPIAGYGSLPEDQRQPPEFYKQQAYQAQQQYPAQQYPAQQYPAQQYPTQPPAPPVA